MRRLGTPTAAILQRRPPSREGAGGSAVFEEIPPGNLTAGDPGLPTISMAVLRVDGRFVLQLRDVRPDISHPGCWGLFCGSKLHGESPEEAMVRELQEELELTIERPRPFLVLREHQNEFFGSDVLIGAFEIDLTAQWRRHRLHEGQAARLFTGAEALRRVPPGSSSEKVLRLYLAPLERPLRHGDVSPPEVDSAPADPSR